MPQPEAPCPALVPPLDDAVYRTAAAARDPAALHAAIERAWREADALPPLGFRAEVIRAHYKPRSRARLLVKVEILRPPPKRKPRRHYLYIQAYPTLGDARQRLAHAAKAALKCVGPATFLIPEWAAVVWALPNGPMLRTTKMLLRRRKFWRFLAEAGLVDPAAHPTARPPKLQRYVPRHRALFRHAGPLGTEPGPVYIKVYAPGQDEAAAAGLAVAHCIAAAAPTVFRVPTVVAHVARRRAIVMREVPGTRLTDVAAQDVPAAFRAAGRALCTLHAGTERPARHWSARREIAALRSAIDDLGLALPQLVDRLRATTVALEDWRREFAFPGDRPIHGNLFGDQVLIDSECHVGIVDWDDVCLGDPLFDIGRLIAHVLFLSHGDATTADAANKAVQALLDGYATGGGSLDHARLCWHVATAILLRAKISALRPLPPTWLDDVGRSLALAELVVALKGQALPRFRRTDPADALPRGGRKP